MPASFYDWGFPELGIPQLWYRPIIYMQPRPTYIILMGLEVQRKLTPIWNSCSLLCCNKVFCLWPKILMSSEWIYKTTVGSVVNLKVNGSDFSLILTFQKAKSAQSFKNAKHSSFILWHSTFAANLFLSILLLFLIFRIEFIYLLSSFSIRDT